MKKNIIYGSCTCGKWGWPPEGFDERKHFMKCPCGKTAFLLHSDPEEAGDTERYRVELTLTAQK